MPVNNETFEQECGVCHFTYQPGILPSGAWQKNFPTCLSISEKKFYEIKEELNRVFTHLAPHQQWLVLFCMESAYRINEALRTTSDDIDIEKGLLTLWSRKKRHVNMKARRIPLSPIIAELKGKPGQKIYYSDRPRFLWRTCKKLDVLVFGFHSFRHLKASEMAANNVPLIEIMNFLGHDNIEVTQKYLRLLGWTQY